MTDPFIDNLAILLLELIILCSIGAFGAFVCDWLEERS